MEQKILIASLLCGFFYAVGMYLFIVKKEKKDANFFGFVGMLVGFFVAFLSPVISGSLTLVAVFLAIGVMAETEYKNYGSAYILSVITFIIIFIALMYPLL